MESVILLKVLPVRPHVTKGWTALQSLVGLELFVAWGQYILSYASQSSTILDQ